MTTTGQVLRIEEINFIRCLILFSDKSVAEFYILFDFKILFLRICPLSRLSSLFPRIQKIPVLIHRSRLKRKRDSNVLVRKSL